MYYYLFFNKYKVLELLVSVRQTFRTYNSLVVVLWLIMVANSAKQTCNCFNFFFKFSRFVSIQKLSHIFVSIIVEFVFFHLTFPSPSRSASRIISSISSPVRSCKIIANFFFCKIITFFSFLHFTPLPFFYPIPNFFFFSKHILLKLKK